MLVLAVMWTLAVWAAVKRRRVRMRQVAADLRAQLERWRELSVRRFNHALLYQGASLAIGWLTSISEKLEQIKRSITSRTEALQDCREMIEGAEILQQRNLERIRQLVDISVDRLRTFAWDKWIVEFLRETRATHITGEARIHFSNDGEWRSIAAPGLDGTMRIEIRTPDSLSGAPTPGPVPSTSMAAQ